MSTQLRWVGTDELDLARVAEARLLCYGSAAKDLPKFREDLAADPRAGPGDCLLAERGGRVVGTATSHSLRMWARGGALPCQGVAWVGTVKTHRRGGLGSGGGPGGKGIATRVMHETIRLARDRGQVVSALMPFRGSFYEHFGYGIMERRCTWTVPVSIFPKESFDGLRFYQPGDLPGLIACRQRLAEAGQCDIERDAATWAWTIRRWEDGLIVIDRPDAAGPVRGWMCLLHVHEPDGSDTVRVYESGYEDPPALRRQLAFLGSLRDQYTRATLTLPAELQLNRLLSEPQITHRDNRNHPTPEARPYTRMQLRILDHRRFLESLRLTPEVRGSAGVTIHEAEGHATRLWLEVSDGRVVASPTEGNADLECTDRTWAAVATGDLRATEAARLGLASAPNPEAARLLDALAAGPAPFTLEYF